MGGELALRAFTTPGSGRSRLVGSQVGRADALLFEGVCEYLSGSARSSWAGHEDDGRRQLSSQPRQDHMVEVGERDDQPDVVGVDEVAEGADVAVVVDARHERAAVGVVERRRERIDVGRDRRRARAAERGDDVDALPGAREEDGRHSGSGYRAPQKAPVEA